MQSQLDLVHRPGWRTMFVMDAMRFDVFNEIVTEDNITGELQQVWSAGCETGAWMRELWREPSYPNITLVSNSAIYWHKDNRYLLSRFNKVVPLWKGWRELEHGAAMWGGVMPTDMVLEHAEKEHVVTPLKRLVIHDIPPHIPFCGEKGVKFLERLIPGKDQHITPRLADYGRSAANRFAELRGYYKEGARKTLHTILTCEWLRERGGLVITSDHGEMIGEANQYGHSLNYPNAPILREVPWMVIP